MMKYLNIVLFAGMIVMNYLANALPLNNKTTGELSDSFPNLFVPAGITFSIWGIIYLLAGSILYCSVYRIEPDCYIGHRLAFWCKLFVKCVMDSLLALWEASSFAGGYGRITGNIDPD